MKTTPAMSLNEIEARALTAHIEWLRKAAEEYMATLADDYQDSSYDSPRGIATVGIDGLLEWLDPTAPEDPKEREIAALKKRVAELERDLADKEEL